MDLLDLMETLVFQAKFESVFYNFIINLFLPFKLSLNLHILFQSISIPFNLYILWKLIHIAICLNGKSCMHLGEDVGIPQHTQLPTADCKHQSLFFHRSMEGSIWTRVLHSPAHSSFRPHPSFLCAWHKGSLNPANWTSATKVSPGEYEQFTQKIPLTVVCWEDDQMPCRKSDCLGLAFNAAAVQTHPPQGLEGSLPCQWKTATLWAQDGKEP